MTTYLIAIVTLLMVAQLFGNFKISGGVFALPFLVGIYFCLLYIGSLEFYLTESHLTFIFIAAMGFCFLFGMISPVKLQGKMNPDHFPDKKFYIPLDERGFRVAVTIAFLVSFGISIYRLRLFGSPLLADTIYTSGMEAVTGVKNKILYVFGSPSLLVLSVLSTAVSFSSNKRFYKILAVLSFLSHIIFQIPQGGKATAIMPFILMFMVFHYGRRRIPRKVMFLSILVGSVAGIIIGGFRIGYFNIYDISTIYLDRLTISSALHLDYLISEWIPENSFQYGGTVLLELRRLIAQVTTIPKEPLFGQLIMGAKAGKQVSMTTGISPELPFFGLAYANFGILGAMLISFIIGKILLTIHKYLLHVNRMNVFSFTLWIYSFFKILGFIRRGTVIISVQKYLLEVLPMLIMITIFYLLLCLPFPKLLKWKQNG